MKVTKPSDIKSKYAIVQLPDFDDGNELIVRIRKASLFKLVKSGRVPNQLLSGVAELFNTKKGEEKTTQADLAQMYDMCVAIAEACLIEPTYKELCDAGIELTDEQLTAILNYSQKGVEALLPFRKEQNVSERSCDCNEVQQSAE